MGHARRLFVVALLTGFVAGLTGCTFVPGYPGQWAYNVIGEGGHIGVEQISLAQPIVRGHTVIINGIARVPVRTVRWTWGDGNSTDTGNFPGTHTYLRPGQYTVLVQVFAVDGRTLQGRADVRIRGYWPEQGHLGLFAPIVQGRHVTISGALRDASLRRLHWTWGDGAVSDTNAFPGTHTYARAGLYTVGAVAYARSGKLMRASTTVRITGPPWPGLGDLTLSPPVVEGRMVSVAGVVGVPFNTIRWDWGDGKTTTTTSFPGRHLYQRAGVYTITVQVQTKSGAVLRSGTVVQIGQPPLPGGRVTLLTPAVVGRSVTINGTVNVGFTAIRWDWGDGTATGTASFPGKHTYARRGTYTVKVQVFTQAGKTLEATAVVRIIGLPPPAELFTLHAPVVRGYGVTIGGTTNVPFKSIRWSWDDGKVTDTKNFPGVHLYLRRGTYNVKAVLFTRAGRILRAGIVVRIAGPPLPGLKLTLLPPVVVGRGVTINGSVNVPVNNMIWSWGDGRATTTTTFPGTHIYAGRGVYTVTVKAQTKTGRILQGTVTVRIAGPPLPGVQLTLQPPVIVGNSVTIHGSVNAAVNKIEWTWGDGRATATAAFPGTHVYARRGLYNVVVKAFTRLGRVVQGTVAVRIGGPPLPGVLMTLQPPVIVGRSVTINGIVNVPVKRLRWFWGDGKSTETAGFAGTHIYKTPGAYTVSVEAHTLPGKTVRQTLRILVGTLWPGLLPGGDLLLVTPVVVGNDVWIYGAIEPTIRQVRWSWGDGKTTTSPHFPIRHTYPGPGVYTVGVRVQTKTGRILNGSTKVIIGGGALWPGLKPNGPALLFLPVVVDRTVSVRGAINVPVRRITWSWGDGKSIVRTTLPVTHLYKAGGTYTVVAEILFRDGRALRPSTTVTIAGPPPPVGDLTLNPPVVAGPSVTIAGTVRAPWEWMRWHWGDGGPIVEGGFPGQHTYKAPGIYTVNVEVRTKAGRTLRATVRVRILAFPPPGDLTLNPPAVLGRRVTVNGHIAVPWESMHWTWGDGTPTRKGGFPGRHTYRRAGLFTIRVRAVTKAGKTLRATVTVHIP